MKPSIENIKGIFFDLGGTLIDVHKLRKDPNFYLNILTKCGIKVGKNRLMKVKKVVENRLGLKNKDKSGIFFKTLLYELGLKVPSEVIAALQHLYRENVIEKAPLKPNCKFVLSKLKKKYLLVIISDTNSFYGYRWLNRWDLEKYFDLIVFTEDINSKKEKLKPFFFVFKKLKLKPHECVMVGDSEFKDIRPAKKLGIVTIKINESEKSSADFKIEKLTELLNLFK